MTTYGNGVYGVAVYGSSNTSLVELKVPSFTAKPSDYGSILLSWGTPSDSTWTRFLLLRNPLGFATTPDDGDVLLNLTSLTLNSLLDTGAKIDKLTGSTIGANTLAPGKIHYYTIFLLDSGSVWRKAGNAIGVAPYNYGTTELMYSYLPMPYKLAASAPLDSDGNNADLLSFLKPFGFTYDVLKTYVNNSKSRYDAANLHGSLVPNLLNELGFSYEGQLGIQQGRRLIKSASEINLKKGSLAGLKTFTSAFTGFNVTVPSIKNLFLTLDAGSFEYDVDGWLADSNTTISAITGLSPESPTVSPNSGSKLLKAVRSAGTTGTISFSCGTKYKKLVILEQTPILANGTNVTLKTAVAHGLSVGQKVIISGLVPSGYNGTVTVTAINGPDQFTYANATTGNITTSGLASAVEFDPKTAGIPVAANTQYSFSIYSRAKTNARTVELSVSWYDSRGAFISTSSTASGTNSTSSWTRPATVSPTSPANAKYAVPNVSVLSAATTEVHYFDSAQFELNSSATTYVDPRRIDIYLEAGRINEVLNPSFEVDTSNWSATNATIARVSGGASGSWSASVTSSNASSTLASSTPVLVTPSAENTFSAYLKTANTASVTLTIEWLTAANASISTATEVISSIASTWTRYSTTKVAPSNAAKANISFVFSGASSDVYSVDAVMFERSSYLNPYFDGDTGYYFTEDLRWENGSNTGGRSLYYKNRTAAVTRLKALLPDYLPYGSSFAVFVGNVLA